MKPPAPMNTPEDRETERIRDQAIDWIVRRDRGLSPNETHEFLEWCAADRRHAAALDRSSWTWSKLQMPVEAPPAGTWKTLAQSRWAVATLAGAAAACAVFVAVWSQRPVAHDSIQNSAQLTAASPLITRVLADGSVVRMEKDSDVATSFTAEERTVTIIRGEAYFEVKKDARRPFVVRASDVRVQAVGTAFAVKLKTQDVDVLVTEGTVAVRAIEMPTSATQLPGATSANANVQAPTTVTAGHRASVRIAQPGERPVTVALMNELELSALRKWREPLIEFDGATLRTIVQEFERSTGAKISFDDSVIGDIRIGGSFPRHDLEGFLALLEENYGIKASRLTDEQWTLSKGQ